MLEKSSTSYLGPGCREFESRHSDQKRLILEQNQSFLLCFHIPVEDVPFSDHISSITDRNSKRTAKELILAALFIVYSGAVFVFVRL